jgi:hypothetical protein
MTAIISKKRRRKTRSKKKINLQILPVLSPSTLRKRLQSFQMPSKG